jgi:tripartite-type tricarboxylate transporter receptor subunit TctC
MPRSVVAALSALATVFATAGAGIAAPDYPTRTVTLVVPFPPGGGVDAMARVVAAKLSDAMRQQFVVDNRAGAGGTIGTRAVAQAAADGYTLLLGHTGTISINPTLYAHAGYDPRRISPVGLVVRCRLRSCAPCSGESISDFIAMAKNNPGKFNLGTSAIGMGRHVRRTVQIRGRG